jgi:hypothetical protein
MRVGKASSIGFRSHDLGIGIKGKEFCGWHFFRNRADTSLFILSVSAGWAAFLFYALCCMDLPLPLLPISSFMVTSVGSVFFELKELGKGVFVSCVLCMNGKGGGVLDWWAKLYSAQIPYLNGFLAVLKN